MGRIIELLNAIVERSGLDRSEGHPLYRYRVTDQELEQLRDALKLRFQAYATLQTQVDKAAFCLFSGEWFRRFYEGGVWSWNPIFDGLDIPNSYRDAMKQQVGDYTKSGLQWWKLEPIQLNYSTRHLSTLVCQGGIPIGTLRNDGASITRFLKTCLREQELYPSEPLVEIFRKHLGLLPQSLLHKQVVALTARFVRAIAKLRKKSNPAADAGESRIAYLDEHFPNWDAELPVRIEDQEAKELLVTLLDVTRSTPASRYPISITTSLQIGLGGAKIVRKLRFPHQMTVEEFQRATGLSTGIPSRMVGFLQSNNVRVASINIAKSHDGKAFRLSKTDADGLIAEIAHQKTVLVLAVGGREIKSIDVAGGEDLTDLPWIFKDGDEHTFVGAGSVRQRDSAVLVAVPSDYEINEDANATLEEVGRAVAGRKLIRLSGEAIFRNADGVFRIKTRTDEDVSHVFELRGAKRRLGAGGSLVFAGVPRIYRTSIDEDEAPEIVGETAVQWRRFDQNTWQSLSDECLGDVVLRVVLKGETVFYAKATIFPRDFRFHVMPSKILDQGEIQLIGLQDCEFHAAANQDLEMQSVADANKAVLKISIPNKKRPATVRMRVKFPNGNQSDVAFVCPTQSISIINALGKEISTANPIPLDRLNGLILQVIQNNISPPYIFDSQFGELVEAADETENQGLWELPLSLLADHALGTLALSADPDGEIQYEVRRGNFLRPLFSWKVARFGRKLNKSTVLELGGQYPEQTSFYIDQDLIDDSNDEFDLQVSQLNHPSEAIDKETVEQNPIGNWTIRHETYEPGYYLAVAKNRSTGDCLRPIRFVVKREQIQCGSITPLENGSIIDSVMNIRSKDERSEEWDSFFRKLVKDFTHPDWQRVDDFIEASYQVPVTTYEVIAALTRNSEAAARYGILQPFNSRLWERLERLPFLWSLIPLDSWLNAATKIRTQVVKDLEACGMEQDKIQEILLKKGNDFATEAPNRNISMACVSLHLWQNEFDVDFENLKVCANNEISGLTVSDRYNIKLSRPNVDDSQLQDVFPNLTIESTDTVLRALSAVGSLSYTDELSGPGAFLNGPLIAAFHTVSGTPFTMDQLRQFKRIRAFDVEFYDKMNAIALAYLMANRSDWEIS